VLSARPHHTWLQKLCPHCDPSAVTKELRLNLSCQKQLGTENIEKNIWREAILPESLYSQSHGGQSSNDFSESLVGSVESFLGMSWTHNWYRVE
jgi:hypothetical protein